MCVAVGVLGVLRVVLGRENRRREAVIRETEGDVKGPYSGVVSEEERIRLGDRDVHWRYTT